MFSKIKAIKDVRSQAKKIERALEAVIATGSSRGVVVKMNGKQEVLELTIPNDLDRAKISEAVKDALNEAMRKLQKEVQGAIKDAGGLPDMSGLGM